MFIERWLKKPKKKTKSNNRGENMDRIERVAKCLEIFAKKLDFQSEIQRKQINTIERLCKAVKEALKVYQETNELIRELLGRKEMPNYVA